MRTKGLQVNLVLGKTSKIYNNKIYKNKDFEESRKYSARRNEIITNRLLILFGLTIVLIACFVFFMNMTFDGAEKLQDIAFAGMIIFGAAVLASFIFAVYRYKNGVDESDKSVHSKNMFGTAVILFLIDLLIFFTYQKWIPFLTAFAISLTILVYVYYLYQKEFFTFSVFTAIGCFLVYFSKSQILPRYFTLGFKSLLALLAVFIFVFAFTVKKNKGVFLKVNILDKNSYYFQFYILSAFLAVSAVLVFQTFFAINFFYIIVGIIVYFIAAGIYFTVRMI